jgi:HEAT repeat protein
LALGGVGGSKEKAWPYILKALEDSDSLIRANAARATANFTHEASQSLPEIVRIAGATNESAGAAIRALEQLGTNASAATPQLEQMLASETDKWRRKDLSDALKSIRGTSGANEPE